MDRLQAANIAEAKLDARLLLQYFAHVSYNDLLVHGDREIDEPIEQLYFAYVDKRASHIPLAQLIHMQEFMGLEFYVNENVLTPRQDTEILVEEVMRTGITGARILDLCTGSGCILLSLLHYMNECTGVGIDISDKALAVAKRNQEDLKIPNVIFELGDLYDVEGAELGKFDILVSNPPYIAKRELCKLMPEVRDHEPLIALDGGESGLDFYERIIMDAHKYLNHGAFVFLEIGYDQGEALERILKCNGFSQIRIVKDYAGLDRVACAVYEG